MATSFTYTLNWVKPLYSPHADETAAGTSMFSINVTGPATSVEAGSVIASIATDLSYIDSMWEAGTGNAAYRVRFLPTATTNVASTAKLAVDNLVTGALLTAATDLDGVTWTMIGIGSGPFASAVD